MTGSALSGTDSIRLLDPTRAEIDGSVTGRALQRLAMGQPNLEVLQCPEPLPETVWDHLDDEFFTRRPDVTLRIYGHYTLECDLAPLRRVPNVRHLAVDVRDATNVTCIAEMPRLESLDLAIFEAQSLDVLEEIDRPLTRLGVGATRSRRVDLAPLQRFRSLDTLFIEGHSRNIEVLSDLRALEDVTLRSVTTPDLAYLAPLDRLWSLDVKLGGIRSLDGVVGKSSIKYLELWQIREFEDVDAIGGLPGLQFVVLQSLRHVGALPDLSANPALRRIVLQNLKSLTDLRHLEAAPAVEEFALIQGEHQQPEDLLPMLRNSVVQRAGAWFGSRRKDEAFAMLRAQYGKDGFDPFTPFAFDG